MAKFICVVPTWQALQKAQQLVFNKFNVNIYGITGAARDTEFEYHIYTETRINKVKLASVQDYIAGIVDTLNSF